MLHPPVFSAGAERHPKPAIVRNDSRIREAKRKRKFAKLQDITRPTIQIRRLWLRQPHVFCLAAVSYWQRALRVNRGQKPPNPEK